ncbi:endonuclease/exonuclease/phosphatase family protein [Psychroflexus sp. CAK8W]|uniref:Endonuclease/exonuclease/phosphatase family protein n=1 Tax=Psychroflexus longus TaxID=2873596 RepID=A0ABS7XH50_9FLAO|nr:endonuclease/exonuclease/phosphatase family protein [Psychroflexus longus]MBZ9778288.1 endonuclease/exonuclease/phosphatase family protein [Psychroflexus longus]
MKKLSYSLIIIVISFLGFYVWATSGEYSSNEERYVIYDYQNTIEAEKDIFSIMTFNIGYLSGMTNNKAVERSKNMFDTHANYLLDLLDKESVDILALQEIDFASSRSFEIDQLELIQNQGNFNYGAKAINWDKNYVPFPYWPISLQYGKIQSGQAIASQFKILTNDIDILQKPIDQPFYYNDFYLDRLIQTSKISLNGRELTVMNIHLEAFSEKTRAVHLDIVFDEFKKLASQGPTILLGDFNEPLHPLASSLMSPFYKEPNFGHTISTDQLSNFKEEHYTFSAEDPDRKIDYIFFSKEFIQIVDSKTITKTHLLSDHLAVMMRFKFRNVNKNLSLR